MQILQRLRGSLPREVSAELEPADEVAAAVPSLDLLRQHNGGDAHVGSNTQFLSLARCSRLFGVHDPCGTRSTWHRPLLLGLTSYGMATSEISHVTLRVRPVTLRPSGG